MEAIQIGYVTSTGHAQMKVTMRVGGRQYTVVKGYLHSPCIGTAQIYLLRTYSESTHILDNNSYHR